MLFIKSTTKTVAPGVYAVDIAAKPPGKTFGVFIAVDQDDPPQDVIAAIESLGFTRTVSAPYTHGDGKKILDLHFHKKGTDIFDGWSDSERTANLKAIDELFSSLGVTVKPRVMSLAEAFA